MLDVEKCLYLVNCNVLVLHVINLQCSLFYSGMLLKMV
jgi:hypothetical protein